MPQLSIDKSKELTSNVPSRRKFCILYSEWDCSICRAEGKNEMKPNEALRLLITPKHWGEDEDFRWNVVKWMERSKPGDVLVTGGKAAVVCVK